MDVGRTHEPGSALMVIAPSGPVPDAVLDTLRQSAGIVSVHVLHA
jgi:hypothetical protein